MEGQKAALLVFIILLNIQSQFLFSPSKGDIPELPDSNRLPVIYYEQETPYYSGPACIQMALSYLSYPDPPPSQDQIAEWSKTSPEEGTKPYNMDNPFRILGFESIYENRLLKSTTEFSEFKEHNSKGHLVIFLIYYDLTENVEGKGVHHYILMTGYDEEGIYVHDPNGYALGGETGPNTYITKEEMPQLSRHSRAFWSLIIPYKAEENSRYESTLEIRGIPNEISTNIYVDGEIKDTVMGEDSITYEFTIGTEHHVLVDPYINGSWVSKRGTEYFCTENTWDFNSWNEEVNHAFTYDYTNHYYLEVSSEHGDPQGSGWYMEGTPAKISVNSPIKMGEGVKNIIFHYEIYYVFDRWTGDITAYTPENIIQMESPKTVVAVWKEMESKSVDVKIPIITFNIIIIIAILIYAVKSSFYSKPTNTGDDD